MVSRLTLTLIPLTQKGDPDMSSTLTDRRTNARALATLQASRALLATPFGWTQGTEARRFMRGYGSTTIGFIPGHGYPGATGFCMMGALRHVAHTMPALTTRQADACFERAVTLIADCIPENERIRRPISTLPGSHVVAWNDRDGRTVDEVLALIDRTIESAKEQMQTVDSK